MNIDGVVTPAKLAQGIANMRGTISAALSAKGQWYERLESLRGKSTTEAAYARACAVGGKELLKGLDRLVSPPPREEFELRCNDGHIPESKMDRALKACADPVLRSELKYMLIGTLEERDRIKAYTQYWELLGIHPDDVEEHDNFAPHAGWRTFEAFKAHEELAKRFAAEGRDEARRHAALAKALRLILRTFFGCAKPQSSLSRLRAVVHKMGAIPRRDLNEARPNIRDSSREGPIQMNTREEEA